MLATDSRAPGARTGTVAAFRARGLEVDDGKRRRAEYSSDASNYRVIPEAVIYPRDADEIVAIVETARETGTPVTARGAGTSIAGNAVGPGVVVDTSKYLRRIHSIDPDTRTAVVDPGVVLSDLQRAAAPHGLRFGPDPSTVDRCTLGGMIGNNACGPRALRFGRTADNVQRLELVDGTATRRTAGGGDLPPGIVALAQGGLATLRTEFGGFARQGSGYGLEHLLPERGSDLAKALTGTEGTCGLVTLATVDLVPVPRDPLLVVLGYADMFDAAEAVQRLLPHSPVAIEGMDSRLVDVVRRQLGDSRVPALPEGGGWLFIEVEGDSDEARERADAMVRDSGSLGSRVVVGPDRAALWRIRQDGVGLAGRTPSGRQAWPGVEDAAVPPEHLGPYLRAFDELVASYGMEGLPYGHFGDGCIHVRLDIPLDTDGSVLNAFMHDAAKLITSYGGSLSGEHGDGRARSELLPYMYGPDALALMAAVKHEFDPDDILNPGVVVRPEPLAASLRRPHALPMPVQRGFAFSHDDGDLTMAAHRCVGVGKCRADSSAAGGFMCPSYLATKDEKDVTRGRARVLQEVLNGDFIGGWDSPELADSLDLCLSCKACSTDCPAGVDMAMMKSEVLHRRYEGRLRPVSHYTLGWMPRWARLATRVSAPVNALLSVRPLERLALKLGGMDTRRSIPRFARRAFTAQARRDRRKGSGLAPAGTGASAGAPASSQGTASTEGTTGHTATDRVVLWVDTFSDNFDPQIAAAAVRVLSSAGYRVELPADPVCCGLTWITTGQLTGAKRQLAGLLDVFGPYAEAGVPIVGLDPSCTAVLRGDLVELLPDDPRSAAVAGATRTLAELLTAAGPGAGPDAAAAASADPTGPAWPRPDLTGLKVLMQPHCHQHSVMGADTDIALLRSLGAEVDVISGCCGLAGNFGMEAGHYEVSVAVAENGMLPAIRAAQPETVLLADGLSCRTQAAQLAGAASIHLAQLLDPEAGTQAMQFATIRQQEG